MKKTVMLVVFAAFVALGFVYMPENSVILNKNFAGDISSVENFTLKDVEGKSHSLNDYKKSKAIVIIFVSTQCPVSNAYNSRMAELYMDYKDKDITILGINSNKAEGVGEIKSHAEKNKFGFPVLKDENNVIADKFSASFTPEVYVLDPSFNVVYHGRIDDSRDASSVSAKDLENALNEILQGKKVSVNKTKAFGCTIKRV
ncbi:MAG: thioredoxin family protein [Ignavibacteriales bacterium]|nr:MAG: thioredoxin family protein [Ignavibacteriales bacterium]